MIFKSLFWILTALWILIVISAYFASPDEITRSTLLSGSPFLIGLPVLFIWVVKELVSGIVTGQFPKKWQEHQRIELVSLADSMGMQGRLFLGSGYINSAPVFAYYRKVDGGGYQQDWQYADGVTVYEDREEGGELLVERYDFAHAWCYWWGDLPYMRYRTSFHIPKGSIVQEFKLDAA